MPNIIGRVSTDNLEERVLDVGDSVLNKPGMTLIWYDITTSDNSRIKSTDLFVHVYKTGGFLVPTTKIIGEVSSIIWTLKVTIKIGSTPLTESDIGQYGISISCPNYSSWNDQDLIKVQMKK